MDFDKLEKAANDPVGTLRSRSEATGRTLGLAFSSYFPLEILDAFGLEGAWMPPDPRADYPEAESVLQAFVCNCVRSSTDVILQGKLPIGLIAGATGCDSRLALATILRTAGIGAPVTLFRLPVTVGTPLAVKHASAALSEFCREAGKALGREPDHEALKTACARREQGRVLLTGFFEGLGDNGLPAAKVYTAALAAQVMDPLAFLEAAQGLASDESGSSDRVRIMLSGSSIPAPRIVADLESLGAAVVADDTCTGVRASCRRVGPSSGDLIEAIGASLVTRPFHGPTMLEPDHVRIRQVVETAKSRDVQAVVMLHYKFCDPHAFEAPGLTEALERADIRSLVLEIDREPGLASRDRTRVETLLEAIR